MAISIEFKDKYVYFGPEAGLHTQGEARAEVYDVTGPRYHDGHDLSAMTWYVPASHPDYMTIINKKLRVSVDPDNEEQVIITWPVEADFTAYAGQLDVNFVAKSSTGEEIIKLQSNGLQFAASVEGTAAPPKNVFENTLEQMQGLLDNAENAAGDEHGIGQSHQSCNIVVFHKISHRIRKRYTGYKLKYCADDDLIQLASKPEMPADAADQCGKGGADEIGHNFGRRPPGADKHTEHAQQDTRTERRCAVQPPAAENEAEKAAAHGGSQDLRLRPGAANGADARYGVPRLLRSNFPGGNMAGQFVQGLYPAEMDGGQRHMAHLTGALLTVHQCGNKHAVGDCKGIELLQAKLLRRKVHQLVGAGDLSAVGEQRLSQRHHEVKSLFLIHNIAHALSVVFSPQATKLWSLCTTPVSRL